MRNKRKYFRGRNMLKVCEATLDFYAPLIRERKREKIRSTWWNYLRYWKCWTRLYIYITYNRCWIIINRLLFDSNLIKISMCVCVCVYRFLKHRLFLIQYLSYPVSRIFDKSLIPDENFIYSRIPSSIVSFFFLFQFIIEIPSVLSKTD